MIFNRNMMCLIPESCPITLHSGGQKLSLTCIPRLHFCLTNLLPQCFVWVGCCSLVKSNHLLISLNSLLLTLKRRTSSFFTSQITVML